MANRDPRTIKPENHREIRKLDGSQAVAKLNSIPQKLVNPRKEYVAIYESLIELLKHYQEDVNTEQDERVLKLADLILDRHTALLNAFTKSADELATLKHWIQVKINDLVNDAWIENQNSAKPSAEVVVKDITDAITKALIAANKKKKEELAKLQKEAEKKAAEAKEESTKDSSKSEQKQDSKKKKDEKPKKEEKDVNEDDYKLTSDVIKKKTDAAIASKQYKEFLNEFKKDFEEFLTSYNKQTVGKTSSLINKPSSPDKIVKSFQPKKPQKTSTNLFKKFTDIFKDKPITKKDRQPKKSLNPFRSFDIKPLRLAMAGSFIALFAGATVKGIKAIGSLAGKGYNLVKSIVVFSVMKVAKMFMGFLALAKGPFNLVLSIILAPIKFIYKAIMFVVKPLFKLVSGLVKIILAPIKLLLKGPIKLIKNAFSSVIGVFSGIFSLIKSKSATKLFKFFMSSGGMFLLGYIVGRIWKKYIQPAFEKIQGIHDSIEQTFINTKNLLKTKFEDYYHTIREFLSTLFGKDENVKNRDSFAYKLRSSIIGGVEGIKWLYKKITGHPLAKGIFNAVEFFVGMLGNAGGMLEIIKSGVFEAIFKTFVFIKKSLRTAGPLMKSMTSPIGKLFAFAIGAAVEGIKKLFRIFSAKNNKLTLDEKYVSALGGKLDENKVSYLNSEQIEQYKNMKTGLDMEAGAIKSAESNSKALIEIMDHFNEKPTDYPGFITEVTTSYALGADNVELLPLSNGFEKNDKEEQLDELQYILNRRSQRAASIRKALEANDPEMVRDILTKATEKGKNGKTKLSFGTFESQIDKTMRKSTLSKPVKIGSKTLVIGQPMTLKRYELHQDETIFKDLEAAGVDISGDWGRDNSEVTIEGLTAVQYAEFQRLRNEREKRRIADQAAEQSLRISHSVLLPNGRRYRTSNITEAERRRYNRIMEEYFSKVDLAQFSSNDEALKNAQAYAELVLSGKQIEAEDFPKASQVLEDTKAKAAEVAKKAEAIDSSTTNNTVIVTKPSDTNNALTESRR